MFTQENTNGYTDAELTALNAELQTRLDAVGEEYQNHDHIDYLDAMDECEKAFKDEVARR